MAPTATGLLMLLLQLLRHVAPLILRLPRVVICAVGMAGLVCSTAEVGALHFKQSEYNQGWQGFFHSHIMWSAAYMLLRSQLKVNMLKTPSHNLCLPSNGDIYAILLFLSQLCQPVRRSATSVCSVGFVMANITVGVVAPPAATLPSLHPCCRFSCSQSAARAFFLYATAAAVGPLLCCCCCPSPAAV